MALRTPLYEQHLKLGAKLTEFAGWELPASYGSILEEHAAVREAVGLFDVSHMGVVWVRGPVAARVAQWVTTRDLRRFEVNRQAVTLLCRVDGGILDDEIVGRTEDDAFRFVANAANVERIVHWLDRHADPGTTVEQVPAALIAVQGPRARRLVERGLERGELAPKRYWASYVRAFGAEVFASRTGYTGEDGFELALEAEAIAQAPALWEALLKAGRDLGVRPCGLGARDILRIEAGMPLYGHETGEDVTPLELNMERFLDFVPGNDFCGRAALEQALERGVQRHVVGVKMLGHRVPRPGHALLAEGRRIGVITSGTFSPALQAPVGLGFADARWSAPGTQVEVDIPGRGGPQPAEVVELPFYRRKR